MQTAHQLLRLVPPQELTRNLYRFFQQFGYFGILAYRLAFVTLTIE
jgi:hypothetical protein